MQKLTLAAACTAALAAPGIALADSASSTAPATPPWVGEVDMSYALKNGNTNTETLNAKANAVYDGERWRSTLKAEGSNSKDTGVRTGERYFGSYQLDRKLTKPNYLFNIVTYEKDLFSGYAYKVSYSLGYGRRLLDTQRQTLDVEIGPGYRVERYDTVVNGEHGKDYAVGRLAGKYDLKLSDHADLSEDVSTETGGEGTTTRSETALTSQLNTHFSLRLSYVLLHNTTVLADTHQTDTQVLASLVYSFGKNKK